MLRRRARKRPAPQANAARTSVDAGPENRGESAGDGPASALDFRRYPELRAHYETKGLNADFGRAVEEAAVSYTHLTLPTILRV